jgi:hypothetical protein
LAVPRVPSYGKKSDPGPIVLQMTDFVALASVVTSGIVGLGGIGAGVWGAAKARRWQGREERVAELRTVLDAAAEHLSSSLQGIAQANDALRTAGFDPDHADAYLGTARRRLSGATTSQNGIWSTHNRLRVRTGSQSKVAQALAAAETQVGLLGAVVRRRLVNPELLGYDEAWLKAAAAEQVFYDAAAEELQASEPRRRLLSRGSGASCGADD